MFSRLFDKIQEFGDHHQILIALIIAFALICVSWGVEKILEEYIFPHKKFISYVLAVSFGLFLLWLTKHVILHVI